MRKIHDRLNNRPSFQGQNFTQDSLTIPGQALTPQEIMRRFVQGPPVGKEVYLDQNIDQFERMDKMTKLDYLNTLKEQNLQNKFAIEQRLKNLQQKQVSDDNAKNQKTQSQAETAQ